MTENTEDITQRHRVRFDGTLSFGHLLTLASFGAAAFTFAMSNASHFERLDFRVQAVERQSALVNTAIEKISESTVQLTRNQDRIVVTMDFLSRKNPDLLK